LNTALQKVSEETMRFMRGKYAADEVGNGKDELKFRRGGKTILAIYIREDRFDFLVIFGKTEREKFEEQRNNFSKKIQNIYDDSKTYHDGKWMLIPIADLETLEEVKKMILIKKKPNRKPFPKETACPNHPCGKAHAGIRPEIHTGIISADDVTWAILPYVYEQYGN